MNKLIYIIFIFIFLLTVITLPIDTTQNKLISIKNQSVEISNTYPEIHNNNTLKTQKNQIDNNQTIFQTSITIPEKTSKPSNEELFEAKFNQILNKKSEVENIWNEQKNNKTISKNKKTTTNKSSIPVTSTIKKSNPQIITTNTITKNKLIDFSSQNFTKELENYLDKNIIFPEGYIISFSFLYSKTGDIADINIISIPEKDYLDGNETYSSNIYGDNCLRENLTTDEMYQNKNSSGSNLNIVTIYNYPDGAFIKSLYNKFIDISTSHNIEQIPYNEIDNYTCANGMYYLGQIYLSSCSG